MAEDTGKWIKKWKLKSPNSILSLLLAAVSAGIGSLCFYRAMMSNGNVSLTDAFLGCVLVFITAAGLVYGLRGWMIRKEKSRWAGCIGFLLNLAFTGLMVWVYIMGLL